MAPKQPLSSTCLSSSCWNLESVLLATPDPVTQRHERESRKGDVLLALGVKVYTTNTTFLLVKTDVVEALETSTVDSPYAMVGHKEVFFPPHKDILSLGQVWYHDGPLTHLFAVLSKRRKLAPVIQIDLVRRTPTFMFRDKPILAADNLTLKVGCQRWVVFR